jgi:hypothetical protein
VQISAPRGHVFVKCVDAIWNLHSRPRIGSRLQTALAGNSRPLGRCLSGNIMRAGVEASAHGYLMLKTRKINDVE